MRTTVHIDSRTTDPGWSTRPPEWRNEALCAQIGDDDIWFPVSGGSNETAKWICRQCPVRRSCLEDAMVTEERLGLKRQGILGGLSAEDRRKLHATGWRRGDPLPAVRLRYGSGLCGVCGGRYGAALALHRETAHGQAGAA